MQDPNTRRRTANRFLIVTWLTWGLSIASVPSLAYLFARFIEPDPSDDFGMGPFLSGVFLGVFLSVLLGVTALVLHSKARQIRPLAGTFMPIVEWLALVLPPALVLVLAAGFVGALPIGLPVVVIGLAFVAFARFRRARP